MLIPGLHFVEGPPGQLVARYAPASEASTVAEAETPERAALAPSNAGFVPALTQSSPRPPTADPAPAPDAPEARETPLTAADIEDAASDAGFADLGFDVEALGQLLAAIRAGKPFEYVVGVRVDAQCTVEVTDESMSAWLCIAPPQGGAMATRDAVEQAIAATYVVHGIDAHAVSHALITQSERTRIAVGTPPTRGADAWFEPLAELNRSRHPHVDDQGHVDYRDLGAIPYVAAGTPLMRLHPAQPGIPGRSVLGTVLPAADGTPAQFGVDLPNTATAAADPNVLVAAAGGQPIRKPDGVFIEELIRFDGVSIATGNIDFDGSVDIGGDVQSGMKIRAGGDVLIRGTCESVHIDAGGEVHIVGGVIGHTPPDHALHATQGPRTDDVAAQATDTAHVIAKGNIHLRHAENAFLQSDHSVLIDEAAVACDIIAIESIVVGKNGGLAGRLMGGVARASDEIVCGTLGATGAGQTRVAVGINPLLQRRLDELKAQLMAQLKEHSNLSKVVKYLKTQPEKADMLEKAVLTLRKVTAEVSATLAEERSFVAHVQMADSAQVIVHQRVLDGTRILIGKRAHYVGETLGPGVFQIQEDHDGLVYAPLAERRPPPAKETDVATAAQDLASRIDAD